MKVTIDSDKKKKRCYTCNKFFEPYSLIIPQEDIKISEGKLVGIKLGIFSLKGNKVELCPSCKIQKFINLGVTLTKAKYKISRNVMVTLTEETTKDKSPA